MKGLIVAIQFMTRLPTPSITVSSEEFTRSIRWFPVVGLIIGAIISCVGWVSLALDSWSAACLALLSWVMVTGALHLDGLGDIADASGAVHKGKERLLSVLADPHVGSFGVTAIIVQLLAKLIFIHALLDRQFFIALILVPCFARIAPLVWTYALPALHEGLGARFRGVIRPIDLILWCILLAAASILVPALLLLIPILFLWARWIMSTIGGISGDGHGAGIEITESLLMLGILIQVQIV